jgi:hypothetical protein
MTEKITNGHQSVSHREQISKREALHKAAHLQYDFAKAWNDYSTSKSASAASQVVSKGQELLDVQKGLTGSHGGSLSPAQVTLRMDYAKQHLKDHHDTPEANGFTKIDGHVFPVKVLPDGTKVWKIS